MYMGERSPTCYARMHPLLIADDLLCDTIVVPWVCHSTHGKSRSLDCVHMGERSLTCYACMHPLTQCILTICFLDEGCARFASLDQDRFCIPEGRPHHGTWCLLFFMPYSMVYVSHLKSGAIMRPLFPDDVAIVTSQGAVATVTLEQWLPKLFVHLNVWRLLFLCARVNVLHHCAPL